jgi:Dyp-type peroxidase family
MEKVEWKDVQRLVQSGFADLRYSAYILWHFNPDPNARPRHKEWLGNLAHRLMRVEGDDAGHAHPHRYHSLSQMKAHIKKAKKSSEQTKHVGDHDTESAHSGAINLALTRSGLKTLGVEDDELAKFSAEFREGMAPKPPKDSTASRRSNVLGDIGQDLPANWEWGGWNGEKTQEKIDGVMLLYAFDKTSLNKVFDEETSFMGDAGIEVLTTLAGRFEGREHFGFKDGISQPTIEGTEQAFSLSKKQRRISVVKPGEFVLGYENERGAKVTFSYSTARGTRDLARNGTYLVFRQLKQHVDVFDRFLSETAALLHGGPEEKEWVAARLVGRNVDGKPLIPRGENSPGPDNMRNDFLYDLEDHFGLACPIGAHIRRANPRDALGHNPETALRLSKMHRIIRRGRIYGGAESRDKNDEKSGACGLHFICLNADIAGQFEMIQHTWLNGASFNGLYEETDPVSHYRLPNDKSCITFQHRPTNLRIPIPKFVTVLGGGYFFLPGIKALQLLAQ